MLPFAAGNIVNADVTLAHGKVFVIWEEFGTEIVKFRSGDYSKETSANYPGPEVTLNIYPNLVNSTLYYSINSSINKNCVVQLQDLNGNLIFDQIKSTTDNIDVSRFKSGVYFIKINLDNRLYIKKFIKL